MTRKLIINLLIFSLLPVSIIGFLFVIPFNKEFGYRFIKDDCYNHASWIYGRMNNPEGIDIAFIGSSRTIHAIPDSLLEVLIKQRCGNALHVANLGYCRFGRNFDYEVVKDLLASKQIKNLVVEVREDEDPYSHLDFGYVASSADVLKPVFFNTRYFSDFWKALQVRIVLLKSYLHIRPQDFEQRTVALSLYGYGASTEKFSARQQVPALNSIEPDQGSLLQDMKMNFPEHFISEIAALASVNNVQLQFVFLPGFNPVKQMPNAYLFYKKYGTVLIPPAEIFSDPDNFKDENHLNDSGSTRLAAWLGSELSCIDN
ncbi:MAG: hypothetical protein WBB36_15720 [Chitinophagales bacterium]